MGGTATISALVIGRERRIWSSVLAAALLAGTLAGAPGAGAAPKGKRAKPATLKLLTVSQRSMLRWNRLRVRVRSRRAGAIRLFARARRTARGAKLRRVTRSRVVRFRRPGRRRVGLVVSRQGRRVLSTCDGARLSLKAGFRPPARAARRRTALRGRGRALRRDTTRCRRAALAERLVGQIDLDNADRCDFLDPAVCLFPWPNDHFTTRTTETATGLRLNLHPDSTPRNRFGAGIDPAPYNRNDGFSPGNMIVTKVPGLDTPSAFAQTGPVPITDVARTYDKDTPVVVVNARTHERHLIWAEIDSNPTDPADVSLIIRPAENFDEGERYIVALRNLRDAEGDGIPPGPGFRLYRDGLITEEPAVEGRRSHFEELFDDLQAAGIGRKDLYLAWDFTVASERNLSERALSIRDDAFGQLGDTNLADLTVQGDAPTFTQGPVDLPDEVHQLPDPPLVDLFELVDGKRDFAPCSAGNPAECEEGESDTTARIITGQLVVPCYLDTPACVPGSRFSYGENGLPERLPGNTMLANVMCTIPREAGGDGWTTRRMSLYGHGLLGTASEVGAGNVQAMGKEHGFVFCATDWSGMSTYDVPNVLTILQDLSNFPTLADRAQQGFVNQLYLGRWMVHPDGLRADADFAGRPIVAERLFYDGNSQGGIMGGALAALGVDHERAVLGVPGMNYSTLLRRSVDFDTYAEGNFEGVPTDAGMYDNYPSQLERPLTLSMIQLLWDRAEANGYAHHMTGDPLPNTPAHHVLLHPAFGDHQVADVTVEVEARTIGASVHRPVVYDGRHPYVEPYFGVPSLSYPFGGSAVVVWDSGPIRDVNGEERGNPAAPTGNVPPREGRDPHSHPRSSPLARAQKSAFLQPGGSLIDVCAGGPCYADVFTGP